MPQQILKNVFGFDHFRPGQAEMVDSLLAGNHALAVMPTGSGKSLCFQIPALLKGGLTLVVSPLVALMEDQVTALKLAGVAADTINSSRGRDINVATWKRAAAGDLRLLYLAPERLMTERMLSALGRLPISLIAIDEAHCLSRWGPSFRPDYEALERLKNLFPGVPIAALTATADETTQDDITARLFGGGGQRFISGFDRPNISLTVEMRVDGKAQLLNVVRAHEGESGIVYCLSRAKTEKMAAFLTDNGIRALPYHAGMTAGDRTRNQQAFMLASGGVVIVATIAFGMGIDKPDVRFVCHTDMPGSVEAYYQEIGRAGRDGLPAVAHMVYGLDDLRMRRLFIEQDGGDGGHKRREHKRLDALIS
ncbi:MAG TPA: ATP-dependent DNA helicase RecQ, partial [Rhodospirillales bacterium]|nr:ATP-dependent DNA helicase RecQ [Rhodospirillales bacterium]